MTNQHPITPPPELVQQWDNDWHRSKIKYDTLSTFVATQAARWGADQELEACCEWLRSSLPGYDKHYADYLHAARRKPPSLKEQALAALDDAVVRGDCIAVSEASPIIRRALESLPD